MGVISPVYTLYISISALAKSTLGSCWDEEGGNPGHEKFTKLKPPWTTCRLAACFFALVLSLICRCIVHFPLSILFSKCIYICILVLWFYKLNSIMSDYSYCWRLEAPNNILQITLSSPSWLNYEIASLFFWHKMIIRDVSINPKR